VSSWFDDLFQKGRTVARCSAVNKLQISGADSTAVNKISGAFNKFFGHSTNFGGIQQISGAFNSIQQQSTAFNEHSGAFNEFRGHSTAFNKISGALNSIQLDIQHDIQNGRFVRLLESSSNKQRPKTVFMRFHRNFHFSQQGSFWMLLASFSTGLSVLMAQVHFAHTFPRASSTSTFSAEPLAQENKQCSAAWHKHTFKELAVQVHFLQSHQHKFLRARATLETTCLQKTLKRRCTS
jgi:hypothetical protein